MNDANDATAANDATGANESVAVPALSTTPSTPLQAERPLVSRAAAVAFGAALTPVIILVVTVGGELIVPSDREGWLADGAGWLLFALYLAGPLVGMVLGVRTLRRLRSMFDDDRPRGRALCYVAVVLSACWLSFYALAACGFALVSIVS